MLKPVNRYLKVKKIEQKKEKQPEPAVLLPDDFKPQAQRFNLMLVEGVGSGCTIFKNNNLKNIAVLVDETMVETYKDEDGDEHFFILESHVIGLKE